MTPNPMTLRPDEPVLDRISVFEENRIHHLPVVALDGEVLGMVSSKDFDNYLNISRVLSSVDRPIKVRDIMTTPVFAYYEDIEVGQAARAMVDNHIHAIVVMDRNDQLVGILTATDLLCYLADNY